jgi:DNA replication protein DnaC
MQVWAEWFQIKLCNDAAIMAMVEAGARWVRAIKNGEDARWLILLGSSGIGKTLITDRIWRWLKTTPDFRAEGDYDPVKLYWPQFVDKLRSQQGYGLFNAACVWPYTYVDDVCSESMSEFSTEKLHNLLGSRDRKWTIVTSNKSLDEIGNLDTRISSRLIRNQSNLVQADTIDYNLRRRA